jgi:hypothetical protein
MDKDLDQILAAGLLEVPEHFAQTVMARVAQLPLPSITDLPRPAKRSKPWLPWLALLGGTVLGAVQLSGFIFGIWAASTAA